MGTFLDELNKNHLTLIVSLPQNSPEMAKAAIEGGAQALKVHINLNHVAAQVKFGSLLEEEKNLKKILAKSKVPVGIVPGGNGQVSQEEMQQIARMGFDFFDIHFSDMEDWMWDVPNLSRMVAVNERYTLDKLISFEARGVNILEAAIVPQSGYGQRLTIGDIQNYIAIANLMTIPVVVPSQREIRLEEVPALWDTGVKGLMIGAIVTGKTPASIKKTTAAFRQAIDRLG